MTRAVILAAGRGTRLGSYGAGRPKCLVEFNGKTLLDRQLSVMKHCGITEVVLVGGYESDKLSALGHRLVLNRRFAETNMVTSLFCAEDFFRGHDLIVAYGDIVYEPRVLKALLASQDPAAVTVDEGWREYWQERFDDPLSDAETLKISSEGLLREVGKKPRSFDEIEAQYIGLFKIRADYTLKFIEEYQNLDRYATYDGKSFDQMYMTSYLQYLIDRGWPVHVVRVHHGWLELDRESDLTLYNRLAQTNSLAKFFHE